MSTLMLWIAFPSSIFALLAHLVDTPLAARKRERAEHIRLLRLVLDFGSELRELTQEYYTQPPDDARDALLERRIEDRINDFADISKLLQPAYGATHNADCLMLWDKVYLTATGGLFRSKDRADLDQAREASLAIRALVAKAQQRIADINHPWWRNLLTTR